ncbi:MAG TPA: methylenetetrahydrofolate reductase [Rectinemataceae bacterium]
MAIEKAIESDRASGPGTRTRVMDALKGGTCISIEVVPPSRGGDLDEIMAAVEAIAPHAPSFISVTDHAGGKAWADSGSGPRRVALRTKPGTLGTAVALRDAFGITTVPHVVGASADRLDVEDLLIDLHYANFRDIFVVMGDERFAPTQDTGSGRDGYAHAEDIVDHVARLNRGEYTPPAQGKPTAFCVGVAAYPQKHFAAPNLQTDLDRLARKIRAGASFAITQMVFEAEPYLRLVESLARRGVNVPVLPGIKPLFRADSISLIPRTFFIDLPQALVRGLEEAKSPAEEKAFGIEWTARLCRDLLDAGAPGLHFFTMGKGLGSKWVLDALFGDKARRTR